LGALVCRVTARNPFWCLWQEFNAVFVDNLGAPKRAALAPSVSEEMLFSLEHSQVSGRFEAGVAHPKHRNNSPKHQKNRDN
jgi:hypothetical protein